MDPTCKPYSHCHSAASPLRRCLLVSLSFLLLLTLLLLILGFTVLRPRHATTIVNSVRLSGLDASIESPSLSLSLNLTLTLDITANNPNHASFRFGQGSAQMYYQGQLVGLAEIPPGEAKAEGSVNCVVDLTVMAGRLASKYSAAYADVVAGSMDFTTETEIPGRVTVLGVLKHHMVSYTTCQVVIGLTSKTLESSDCRYRTKF
ncbi:Late embryogenesis abundant protein [Carex littledalei]|uniref:Late embryogenesis abundant protein n=1 Tax=Carex littledalei TaxID=544730 RepID=A0A833Q9W2_9POAL|nr:Late embryogenesis abundant protein [Carex littledalei]